MTKEQLPGLETKLVEVITQLQNGIATVADGVYKVAPQALDAALWVVRVDGMQSLLIGTFFLAVLGVLVLFLKKTLRVYNDLMKQAPEGMSFLESTEITSRKDTAQNWLTGGSMAAVVVALPALINLLSVWNWVAVFKPELALARSLLEKAGVGL